MSRVRSVFPGSVPFMGVVEFRRFEVRGGKDGAHVLMVDESDDRQCVPVDQRGGGLISGLGCHRTVHMAISRFTLDGPKTAVYSSTDLTGTKIDFLSEQEQPVF